MKCEICNGNLYYLVYDKHADNMAKMDCLDCLSVIQYNDDVKERITKLLMNASPQKLAQIVATMLVNATGDDEVENKFEPLIEESRNSYEEILEKTTKSIEKFIENTETDQEKNVQ